MKLKISFKHLEHTPSLDQRIKEKSEKFEKYFQGNTSVQWTCWVHHEEHWAEVKVHGTKYFENLQIWHINSLKKIFFEMNGRNPGEK